VISAPNSFAVAESTGVVSGSPSGGAALAGSTAVIAGGAVAARAGSVAPLAVLAEAGQGSEPTVRYKVQFTAGTELHDKIARAQALLRHQIPDGDLAAVVDRAMTLLVRELERVRFAATDTPRKSVDEVDPEPSSRQIPAPIRRVVWERDSGQCAFRDRHGRRCQARERLEFHHLVPFAQGGDHSASNVSLRCSAHNAYQAELDYGADFMARARLRSRTSRPDMSSRRSQTQRTSLSAPCLGRDRST
jgi:5-methylcytosine-specific restriction endonuclease McrA